MLNRRSFARLLSLATAAAAFSGGATNAAAPSPRTSRRPLIKPRALKAGDTIGLVLPASSVFEDDEITYAKQQMEALGFKVLLGQHVYDRWGYFAGKDEDRAGDINRMFADDNVAAVVCYTGGWGSPRILPLIDYDLIARRPKVFIGFSDVTVLLNAIHQRTGLVTFHGPTGGSTFETYTAENFRRVVMTAQPAGLLQQPSKRADVLVDRANRVIRVAGGKATGPLVGGNLTMLASTMGTPYEVETDGAIFFLEDIREDLYRIDRMLTQLALGGKFSKVAGVVFGRCTECGYKGPTFSLEEILRDRFGKLGVPMISGVSFGHIEQKLVLPVGVRATLDADAMTLTIDEAAVV